MATSRVKTYDVAQLRECFARAFPFGITPAHTDAGHFYQREDTGVVAASTTTQLGILDKPYLVQWARRKTAEYIRDNLDRLLAGDLAVIEEACKHSDSVRDTAASIGTSAHDAYDRFISRWIETSMRPAGSCAAWLEEGARTEEIAACRSFDLFLEEQEIIPIASELRCWYEKAGIIYAGTIDSVVLWLKVYKGREGDKGIIDPEGNPHEAHQYQEQAGATLWCAACGREVEASLALFDWKTSRSIAKVEYAWQTVSYAHGIEEEINQKFDEIVIVRFSKERAEYEMLKVSDRKKAWEQFSAISKAHTALSSKTELLEPIKKKQVFRI